MTSATKSRLPWHGMGASRLGCQEQRKGRDPAHRLGLVALLGKPGATLSALQCRSQLA